MLVPGFEVICKVRADLTACLNAHPVLRSKNNGKEYKKVEVRIRSMLTIVYPNLRSCVLVQDRHCIRRNRD